MRKTQFLCRNIIQINYNYFYQSRLWALFHFLLFIVISSNILPNTPRAPHELKLAAVHITTTCWILYLGIIFRSSSAVQIDCPNRHGMNVIQRESGSVRIYMSITKGWVERNQRVREKECRLLTFQPLDELKLNGCSPFWPQPIFMSNCHELSEPV